jgi:hypothetical protein
MPGYLGVGFPVARRVVRRNPMGARAPPMPDRIMVRGGRRRPGARLDAFSPRPPPVDAMLEASGQHPTIHDLMKHQIATEAVGDEVYLGRDSAGAVAEKVGASADAVGLGAAGGDAVGATVVPGRNVGLDDVHVLLDSWLKDENASNPYRGVYSFSIFAEGSTSAARKDIGISGVIRDAIELAVEPILIPLPLETSQGPQAHDDAVVAGALTESVSGMTFYDVRLATTAALAASAYDNGVSGVGATLTADANGVLADIDGLTPAATNRVIVNNQADSVENGVYDVTDVGSGATPWILTRSTDADSNTELTTRGYTPTAGTANSGKKYLVPLSLVVIGTSDIDFAIAFSATAFADPIVSSATALTHPYSPIPVGGHISMHIREIPRQAYQGREETPRHIEFTSELVEGAAVDATGETQQMLRLTPLTTGRGRYVFTHPVRQLDQLTVQFYAGDRPLPLPLDTFDMMFDLVGGAPRLCWPKTVTQLALLADRPAAAGGGKYFPVQVGDRIYLEDVAANLTASPSFALDAFNAYMNRREGHLVASLTDSGDGSGNMFVRLFPELTGFAPSYIGFNGTTGTTAVVRMFVERARVRIPLRVRCLAPDATNSLVAT